MAFLAFELIAGVCSGAASLTESVWRDEFKGTGFPFWTQTVLASQSWLPCAPLPWLLYSVILTRRTQVSVESVFTFAGTICLGCSAFLCWVAGGLLLPFFATHILVSVRTVVGQ